MAKRNFIKGTKGNDDLSGTSGNDVIISGRGNDTVDGGAGHDCIHTGKGDDIVNGGSGNDYIKAGKGDDTVTGGAGDDCVHLGKGNDTAVYVLADNVDSEDFYNGGKGHDTLRLEFTSEEWQRADIQADIAAYLAFLNGDEVPDEYWHNRSTFEFNAFNLTTKKFENLELVVDGQIINPGNGLVDAVDDSFTVSEDGIVSGNVLDNDDVPDLVASITVEDDVTKGILTLNPDGSFSFDTNGEFDDLDAGDTETQTFTYKVIDTNGDEDIATVTFTITGTDDASVVAGSFTGMVTEGDVGDPAETAMGTLSISDVDGDDNPSFGDQGSTVGDNGYGSFVLAAGVWTYTLDQSAVQDLDAGDSVNDSITYTATDGTMQQIVVTIEGTDDASVVAGMFTGMVTEGDIGDPAETAMGTLSISDVDGDDTPSFADQGSTVGDNGYGSFVLAAGVWTYTLDQSAVQDLDAGDSVNDSITYTATDGTMQQIVVSIEGTDDASVVAGSFTGMVTEGDVGDPAETAMGTLSISDVDGDDMPSFADQGSTVGDNGYGSFVLAAGVWTYTLDQSTVQDLDAGDSVNDSITYTATDGTMQQIVVTIEGTDDASVVAGMFTGMVTEGDIGDPAETAMGTLSISDVDGDDNPSFADQGSTVGDNGYGSFVLAAGVWTYTLDQSAVQDLDAGDSVTDSITYTATDGTTQQIVVMIEGTDDASVVAGSFTGMVTEGDVGDPAETAMGTLSISDVDGDDMPSFADQGSTVGDNGYGSFVLAAGTWTYTLDQSAVQDLDAGDSVNDSITYTATDGTTQQIAVMIEGTDDASVVAGSFTGMVTEGDVGDPAETAMGTLSISDVDGDDMPSFADQGSTVGDNGFGSFVLAAGVWTYTLDQATVQDLDAGDTVIDSLTYTASDGTSQQIDVTILGTNDAPVALADAATVDEDGSVLIDVLDNDSDIDGVMLSISNITDPANGTAVLQMGQILYTPDPDFSGDDSFTYTIDDGAGGTDTQTVTLTVNVDADTPMVTASLGGAPMQLGVPVALTITGIPADMDGSEQIIEYRVDGLPEGATLNAGVVQLDGSVILTPAELSGLELTVSDVPSFGASLDLSTLNGSNGFTLNGIDASDWSGYSVSGAGDINGDGIDDLIIGAYRADPNGDNEAGESYVVFGQDTVNGPGFGANLDLSTLNGSNGFTLNGIDANDLSGFSVSGAGDINGDGIDDLIIGAVAADPNVDSQAGESYVVFGQDTVNGPGFGANLDLSTLNGSNGFTLNGIDASDQSGYSVSGAGDINGDGIDDLIIGARLADPNGDTNAGESYVVFGQDTVNGPGFGANLDLSTLNGSNGFTLNGIDANDWSGFSVSGAGDINGDGIDDLIIGAYLADPNGDNEAGESYVVFGQDTVNGPGFGANLDLSTLNGSNGFTLNGIDANDLSGFSVSGAGDINGDGIDDLIIGAVAADPNGDSQAGESYVVFGQDTVNGPGFGANLDLSTLNGSNGFTLNGIDASDQSGYSVSGAGDINGDGIDDLIIGAYLADPNGDNEAGESYVVFGQDTVNGPGFGANLDLSTLNGSNGFTLNGIDASDWSGYSVSGAGDINGDGIDDLIIGAYRADPNGDNEAGESYVVFGRQGIAPEDFQLTVEATVVDTNPDNAGDTDTAVGSTTLDVDVNQNPTIEAASFTVDENEQQVGTISFSDPDGDDVAIALTINAATDNALFAIDPQTGLLTFIDSNGADFENPLDIGMDNIYDIEVEVTDSNGAFTLEQFQVTVDDVGQAVLEISGLDPFRLGSILVGDAINASLVITNTGMEDATDLTIDFVDPNGPFSVTGGSITLDGDLQIGASEVVSFSFQSNVPGTFIHTLQVNYFNGEEFDITTMDVMGTAN